MLYKIHDNQNGGYFADGSLYSELSGIREQLASYHDIDWSGERPITDLSLWSLLDYGDWSIETEAGDPVHIIPVTSERV